MVKPLILIKSKYFLKRELVLAITTFVVVFSFLGYFVSAAEMKISDKEVEKVKTALGVINTASNFGNVLIDGGNLMTVLKTAVRGGQTATNVTYGLLVLSAINEMEFMDMVLSQDYKDEARDYFNQILDERTSLRSYWKGVGFDIPKVVSGRITSPMSALALNTFEMTDKTIQILTAFSVLQKEKQYDGLWRYFDERRNGESHQGAWELAEPQMGWAVNSVGFRRNTDRTKDKTELEQKFSSLYDKWSPYTTPYGISKEYKEQLASELLTTLVSAIEENTGVQPQYVEERSVWDKFTAQLASIKNAIANIVSQVKNPFSAGPVIELPLEILTDVPAGIQTQQEQEIHESADVGLPPSVATLEMIEVGLQSGEAITITEPIAEEPKPVPEALVDDKIMEVRPPLIETQSESDAVSLCRRENTGMPRQYRVLINEVAWMGDKESPNNEWIEFKNIWGMPVNLNGWQLQDKDQQIKVIFEEDDAIPAGEYLILERGKDYTGALNNSNEALYLFDNNCQIEDEVLAIPNWPGGDNTDKKTMQRFDLLGWYTGASSAGAENSSPPAALTHPADPAPAPVSPSKTAYLKILITETRTGSPGNQKDDFVELYNPNSEPVDLTDWYLQRKTETGQDFSSYAPASLFSGKTIGAQNYFLIANASSSLSADLIDAATTYSLTENNALILKDPNQEIIDEVSTGNAPAGKSHSKKWSTTTKSYAEDFEPQFPTPRAQNQSSTEENEEEGDGDDDNGNEESDPIFSVVINEIAWMGTKAKSKDEWIELYNNATSSVNLTNWRLAANDGGPDITFATSTIPAQGYFLIERTDDSAISDILADWSGSFGSGLSNNGETINLYDNFGNLIDSVDFSSDWPAGQASPNYISMERINSTSTATSTNWASNNRISKNGRDAGNNNINGTPKAQNSVSKTFTEIIGGITFEEDLTLTYLGSPYLIDGSVAVKSAAKLTIESGVVIKFKESNNGWHSLFTVEGKLEAVGVTFTSSSANPSAGDWDGIYFKESAESKLENAIIKYAGKIHKSCCYEYVSYTNGAVKIQGGQVSIKNSFIENSQAEGLLIIGSSPDINNVRFSSNNLNNDLTLDAPALLVGDSGSIPTIASSTFIGNKIGILIKSGASPQVTGNIFKDNETPIKVESSYPYFFGNSAQNNTNGDGVFFTGVISQNASWQADLPYIIQDTLAIADGAELTIASSTIVKFNGGSKMLISGSLLAQGTAASQIIFTSITDSDPENNGGYYIYFNPSSKNSVLDYTIVKYGGYHINDFAGDRAAITIENTSSTTISNSIIENNFFAGAHLINSASVIKNTTFRDNKVQYSWWGIGSYSRGLSVNNSNAASLSGLYFERNYHGIYIDGDCPDLSGAAFGTGVNANTINVYPSECQP